MILSIKDAVKNIRDQHNVEADTRICHAASRIFELLEKSLTEKSWVCRVDDRGDYCQVNYNRIPNKQGETLLENLDIRLYKDKIQLNASLYSHMKSHITPERVNTLEEFLNGRTKHYDFPINFNLFIAENLIYSFKCFPSNKN